MLRRLLFTLSLLSAGIAIAFTQTAAVHHASVAHATQQQQELNRDDETVRDYHSLSALKMPERRKAFASLPSESKSGLWRVHLKLYLSQHPELTEAQKEVIQEGIRLATPQLFQTSLKSPEWQAQVNEPLQRLTKAALEAFPPETAKEIFTVLGEKEETPEEDASPLSSNSLSSVRLVPAKLGRSAPSIPSCNCSMSSDWCYAHSCRYAGCELTDFCGTLWVYLCNGMCRLYAP